MLISPMSLTDFRLFSPEVIELEPEHFEQARELSNKVTDEANQWQTYLNALAQVSFEEWLKARIPDGLGEFKFCAIATEHLLDEVVNIPQNIIQYPEIIAHFYVVIEVLEEAEQVIIRGFLNYNQLVDCLSQFNLQLCQDGCYHIPLDVFDTEPNHLLSYCRFLSPSAFNLPVAAATKTSENLLKSVKETRTKLSQWLENIFDDTWQAIDALISPEAGLAWSTRNVESGAIRCKLIDLGIQLDSQTIALLVNVIEETDEKLRILLQLHPTSGQKYLPPDLKLTLLSKAGKVLQDVTSRSQDNYIQLKSFKGEPGKRFSVEVSLNDAKVKEDFEF
ncbi:DUF1822 family protein [Microseira wollei]|uniref:DUF1822 family protein n=1 Tax=Microseira wollei NIES-4236 TaxID=2530354 RepID=A0AAV3WZB0_9CYAN|nr:DUF1822 family protein [Microseira wollei]GET35717.1 hypothetical protein MiSe_04620 [Microseira wollei NIES-4236]